MTLINRTVQFSSVFCMNFQIASDPGPVPCHFCEFDSTPSRLASTILVYIYLHALSRLTGTKCTRCCTHIPYHCYTTLYPFANSSAAACIGRAQYIWATGCVILQEPPSRCRSMLSFWECDTIRIPQCWYPPQNVYTFTGLKPVNGYKLYPLSHLHRLTLLYYSFGSSLSVACVGREQMMCYSAWISKSRLIADQFHALFCEYDSTPSRLASTLL